MALQHLLQDLSRLHRWQLHLWHGDHGWHAGSSATAADLARWLKQTGRPLLIDRAEPLAMATKNEAEARHWRYRTLLERARQLDCSHVVTGHTASDRAETLMMNLARGSHRRGLASLRPSRPLAERQLVRPLLIFSRRETARMVQTWNLPIWPDPSNDDLSYERNRVRQEVMPILDALHPGVEQRLAALAERLAQEEEGASELTDLALAALRQDDNSLRRTALTSLGMASQRRLLQAWLGQNAGLRLRSSALDRLLDRLASLKRSGSMDLSGSWRLQWRGDALTLAPSPSPAAADEHR